MGTIYKNEILSDETMVIENMRKKLSKEFGVTVQGNRVTVRWDIGKDMVNCHMIIVDVTTPSDIHNDKEKSKRLQSEMDKLYKKYPKLRDELELAEHIAEYNEIPQ